jgi:small glutamine-rich tetratricopeptide repeat-containing protein alpha
MQSTTPNQRLALAICEFLSKSLTDGTLPADDKESIDVAITCIAESFKVDPAAKPSPGGATNLLQIFTAAEASQPAAGASAGSTGSSGPTPDQKKDAEALKSKGNASMAAKNYPEAIDFYTKALALDPGNAVFLSNRAAAHSATRDHESARADAEAAVAVDPKYTKGWSRLGLARFALGDAKGSMEAYKKGIEHEGSGGSEAMKKGFETAKRRVEEQEQEDEDLPRASPSPGAGGPGAAGMPDLGGLASLLGGGGQGGGAGGGMPDFSQIMNNPMFASMAQNLMSNPDLMANLMGNPRLREMANQFGTGGGMPDMSTLMSDPSIAEM